jgi:DNA-binding NtrC family response regulator
MRPRVLVADDQVVLREMIIDMLAMLDIHAVGAGDGVDALEKLDDNPDIRVLLTDIRMPRMGGYDLALEATRRAPDLKVMLMTGFAEEGGPATLMAERNIRTLFKPFALNGLAKLVKQMLSDGS